MSVWQQKKQHTKPKAYQSRQAPMKSRNHKSSCAALFSKLFSSQITCQKKKKVKCDIFTFKAGQEKNSNIFPVIKLYFYWET